MTNNVLDYLKAEAAISFDAQQMMFVGEIEAQGGPILFTAEDMGELHKKYELAVMKALEIDELYQNVVKEVTSVSETIMSGEAKIHLGLNETNERIGMMIKMMLSMADGAAFYVKEKVAN